MCACEETCRWQLGDYMSETKKIDDLNEIAIKWVHGEIEPLEVLNLKIFDRLLVTQLAFTYGLTKVGFMSRKTCARYKFNYLQEHRGFKLEFFWLEKMQEIQRNACRGASGVLTEITKMYSMEDVDIIKLCEKQAECIDLLTNENVHLQLFHRSNMNNSPKYSIQQALKQWGTKFIEMWGAKVPYEQILTKFIDAQIKDDKKEMWEQLTGDDYPSMAIKKIPLKDDDHKGMVIGIEKHYGKVRE